MISVRFKDGTIAQVKAGNIINSSSVFVAEGYCWCLSNPIEQISDTRVLRSRPNEVDEAIVCQLVAATILKTLIDRKLVADIAPYDTGVAGRERAIIPENPTWSYNEAQDYCLLTDDGSGQYTSLEACYAANKSSTPQKLLGRDWQFTHSINYNQFYATIPTETNSTYSSGFGLYGQFTDSFQDDLTYFTASNGDIIRGNNLFGIDQDNDYQITSTFRTGTSSPRWFYAEMEKRIEKRTLSGNVLLETTIETEIIELEIGDGSIVCSTAANLNSLSFSNGVFNYIHPQYYQALDVVDRFSNIHPKFTLNLPSPFYMTSGTRPEITYFTTAVSSVIVPGTSTTPAHRILTFYVPKVWSVFLSIDNDYYRNTSVQYNTHEEITSLYVKFHDPDSKLVKVDEYEYGRTRETNFVHLGDKALIFIKKEKLQQPNKPYEEREWFKAIVKKLTPVLQPDETYEVEIEEFEYINPQLTSSSP